MGDMAQRDASLLRPDGFHAGRLAVLQPSLRLADLSSGVTVTEDPFYLECLTNLLRVWSQSRHDLPYSFPEEVCVITASRQPIALFVVDVQHIQRVMASVQTPYEGGPVDSSSWPTDDLFELVPVSTIAFPPDNLEERVAVPGREQIQGCRECRETGHIECSSCGGTGQLLCEVCGGAQRVECPQCNGAGTHMGVRGRMIQCRVCNTRGTISCDRCVKGQVVCRSCTNGTNTCTNCTGYGKLKQSWELRSRMITKTYCSHNMTTLWPIDTGSLYADSDPLYCRTWEWPLRSYPNDPLVSDIPDDMQPRIHELLRQGLEEDCPADSSKERITGARIRVSSTYVYCVDYAYREQKERVYISGGSNRVFTDRDAIRAPGLGKRLATLGLRLFDKVMNNAGPPLDREYLKAVQGGKAHIADSRCLLSSVAQLLALKLGVTEEGYRFVMPPQGATFDIAFQTNSHNEWILCVKHVLGPAHRNRFAQSLAASHSLSFGRIAVVDDQQTGQPYFEYVERRLYQLTKAHHLAHILRAMAMDVAAMHQHKVLL